MENNSLSLLTYIVNYLTYLLPDHKYFEIKNIKKKTKTTVGKAKQFYLD